MTVDAVIFDCDGTLVDSEIIANEVLVECVRELGLAMTLDEAHRRFTGYRIAACVEGLERDLGHAVPPTFVDDARARMDAAFAARLRPIEGAADLVRSLTVPCCVATGGPRGKAESNLARTGLLTYFEGRVFSSYDLGTWKPDPGLFLHAAAQMGVLPARCTVVEDSAPGIEAGIAARMRVIAFQPDAAQRISGLPASVAVVERLADVAALLAGGQG